MRIEVPQVCPTCNGTGAQGQNLCPTCQGTGTNGQQTRTLTIRIPAGIDNDGKVRVSGEGGFGINGGPNGDLYLIVTVRTDSRYEREGQDLRFRAPIDM